MRLDEEGKPEEQKRVHPYRHLEHPAAPQSSCHPSSLEHNGCLRGLAHAGFVLVGVVNTFLGPMLPILSVQWGLDDARAGRLFGAQFFGAMIGSALSGELLKRFGYLRTLIVGFLGMALAIACLGVCSPAVALLAILWSGISFGIAIPTTNVLISEINPERRAAALNLVNVAWCLGSISGPPLLAISSRNGIRAPMLCLSSMLALVAILLSRCRISGQLGIASGPRASSTSALRAWATPYAIITGILIFIYVGTETSTGGWVTTYAKRLASPAQTSWALTQAIFWSGLLGARVVAPVILRRHSPGRLIIVGMITAMVGLGIILLSSGLIGVAIGAGVTGFGLGPVFPTTFAMFSQKFGALASRMAGFVFVIANLGAAVFPWAVGYVADWFGSLRSGFLIPAAGTAAMIAVQIIILVRYPVDANTIDPKTQMPESDPIART